MTFLKSLFSALFANRQTADERYLHNASNHADLERRMRHLERHGAQQWGRGF